MAGRNSLGATAAHAPSAVGGGATPPRAARTPRARSATGSIRQNSSPSAPATPGTRKAATSNLAQREFHSTFERQRSVERRGGALAGRKPPDGSASATLPAKAWDQTLVATLQGQVADLDARLSAMQEAMETRLSALERLAQPPGDVHDAAKNPGDVPAAAPSTGDVVPNKSPDLLRRRGASSPSSPTEDLEGQAQVSSSSSRSPSHWQWETSLVDHVLNCDLEGLKAELRSNANPNARNKRGVTALVAAAEDSNMQAVQTLLEFTADPTVPERSESGRGRTPLEIALARQQHALAEILVKGMADSAPSSCRATLFSGQFDQVSCIRDDSLTRLGKDKFPSLCVASNGRLFCAPASADSVLVIFPRTGKLSFMTDPRLQDCEWKYFGICPAFNGRLYCAPSNADNILVIDPSKGTLDFLTHERLRYGSFKYRGICEAPNGRLFCAPFNAEEVMVINAKAGIISFIRHERLRNADSQGGAKYSGICAGPNGQLYCAPSNADDVMVIDPMAGTINFIVDDRLRKKGTGKYSGICLGNNGLLYSAPSNADDVLVIDPDANTLSFLSDGRMGQDRGKYSGLCVAPDGRILCAPLNAKEVLSIDTQTHELSFISDASLNSTFKYAGICAVPGTRRIFCSPVQSEEVLAIDVPDALALGGAVFARAALQIQR